MKIFSSGKTAITVHPKPSALIVLFLFIIINLNYGRNNPIGRLIPNSDIFKWKGCENVKPEEFIQKKLVTAPEHNLLQPSKIHFDKSGKEPNFYFLERITGKIRYYVDATGEVKDVGRVKIHDGGMEDGLNGIALDYDFDKTRWMYLFYSIKGFFRVSRFKITPENTMDMSSEQVILDIPKVDGQWHASGSMDFDAYGDLWISVGDNLYGYYKRGRNEHSDTYVSMATADLLGSWLRIHPIAEKDAGGKFYTIPKDNFGEYWAKKFEARGESDLAADYRNPEVVLPEIFAKGVRNSWGFKVVEPVRRFVASGECGPDYASPDMFTEETNITNKPGFLGWPIYAGISRLPPFYRFPLQLWPSWEVIIDSLVPEFPENTKIKGVRTLPPIVTPVYKWEYLRNSSPDDKTTRSCGTGADMYWYDGKNPSKRKFPPHFNAKLFATDFEAQWIRIVTLNESLDTALSESEFWAKNPNIQYEKPLDIKFGPDGALYVIHWIGDWFKNSEYHHISRIEYTGDCHPPTPVFPPQTTNLYKPDISKTLTITQMQAELKLVVKTHGFHSVKIANLKGGIIASKKGRTAKQYNFTGLRSGIYIVTVDMGGRKLAKKVFVKN